MMLVIRICIGTWGNDPINQSDPSGLQSPLGGTRYPPGTTIEPPVDPEYERRLELYRQLQYDTWTLADLVKFASLEGLAEAIAKAAQEGRTDDYKITRAVTLRERKLALSGNPST